MTDHELDRRLAAAFDVAPSSDFLARVRTAVAAKPGPTRWRFSWSLAAAGAAVAVAIGIAAAMGWLARDPSPSLPAVASVPPAVAVPAPHVASAPAVVSNAQPPDVSRARRRPSTAAPGATSSFPTVIVSADEARSLDLLIRAARAATIPAVLPMDDVSARDPLAVPRIEIAPVAIEPLPDLTRLEQGDRQQ